MGTLRNAPKEGKEQKDMGKRHSFPSDHLTNKGALEARAAFFPNDSELGRQEISKEL